VPSASGPKPKRSKHSPYDSWFPSCDRDERMNPRLTNGLVRDLVAPDGDSIPVHGTIDAALKVWELDAEI